MSDEPFQRDEHVDKPGIVGARWWHKTLTAPMRRRTVIKAMLLAGGALAGVAAITAIARSSTKPDYEEQKRPALDLQKEYGWSFGAVHEALVFDGMALK